MRSPLRWLLLAPPAVALAGAAVFLGAAVAQGPGAPADPTANSMAAPAAPPDPTDSMDAPVAPPAVAAAAAAGEVLPRVEVSFTPLAPVAPAAAREDAAEAEAPRRPTVGDHVEAVLTLHAPAGLRGEPRFPAWRERWGEARVIAAGEPERLGGGGGDHGGDGGGATYRQRLVLAAFRPGRVPLPPVAVAVPLAERTVEASTPESLALDVVSVLPADASDRDLEPRPAVPPRPLPLGARFWWTAAALGAACLAAGLLLWRRSRTRAGEAAAVPLAPLEELMGALAALGAEPSDLQLHTRLSLALRRYLGRALGFPAAESTTSELQRRLAGRHLPAPLVRRTVELLRACDLVKFARQPSSEARSRERVGAAREIAGEVERIVNPPQPEAAPPGAAPAEAPLRKAG